MTTETDFYKCNDTGNKNRFIARCNNRMRYIRELRSWNVWDKNRYCEDEKKVHKVAEETANSIFDEVKQCADTMGKRALSAHANRSLSKSSRDAMLALASKDLGVSIAEFDTNPIIINCLNGVVNLRTGELSKHSPDMLLKKRANACYNPEARCLRWLKFLDDVFEGDKELIAYVQRVLGYALTGDTNAQKLFVLYGLGANGKSTMCETLLDILNDYGCVAEFQTFLSSDKHGVREQEAVGKLRGIRCAIASETNSTQKFNEALVKRLTGGDTLTGAKLHGDSYEFTPTHKLFFQANHLPGSKDGSHGFWRRIVIIPFDKKFTADEIIPDLKEQLLRQRDGIFKWLIDGAKLYLESGLGTEPKVCQQAQQNYKNENDYLSRFIAERLVREKGARAGCRDTYEAYNNWCFSQGVEPTPLRFFSSAMTERGIPKKDDNKGSCFPNYRLRSGEADPTADMPKAIELENVPSETCWGEKSPGILVFEAPQYTRVTKSYADVEALLRK